MYINICISPSSYTSSIFHFMILFNGRNAIVKKIQHLFRFLHTYIVRCMYNWNITFSFIHSLLSAIQRLFVAYTKDSTHTIHTYSTEMLLPLQENNGGQIIIFFYTFLGKSFSFVNQNYSIDRQFHDVLSWCYYSLIF